MRAPTIKTKPAPTAKKKNTTSKIDTALQCPHCRGIGLSKAAGRPAKGFEGKSKYRCPVCEIVTYEPILVNLPAGEQIVEVLARAEERMMISPEQTAAGGTTLLLPYKNALPLLCGSATIAPLEGEDSGYYAIEEEEETQEEEAPSLQEESPRAYHVESGREEVVLREKGKASYSGMDYLRVVVYGGKLKQQMDTLQEIVEKMKNHMEFGWTYKSQTLTESTDTQYGTRLTFTTFVGAFTTHPIAERVTSYIEGVYHPNPDRPQQKISLIDGEVIVEREPGKEARAPWAGSYAGLLFSWGREVFSFLSGKRDTLW